MMPRRPSRVRVTRCRTSVTMVLASATRCHLSTAICTPGSRRYWLVQLNELASACVHTPNPMATLGRELIAAGLLILAGVTDRREVERWTRVGCERGRGSLAGYDPSG